MGITIADVSGKGVSAAFYMAVVKGMMASLAQIEHSPKKLLSELNRRLFKLMDRRMFMTMSYGVIDVQTRTLTFARAGHNSLLKYANAESPAFCLTPAGIGLELTNTPKFTDVMEEQVIPYEEGDIFLFYTDGISEAMNEADEEFGEEKLLEYLSSAVDLNSRDIREKIVTDVDVFTCKTQRQDDMTMVVLKVSGSC